MNNWDDFYPASNSEQYEKSNTSYQVENQVINKLCDVIIKIVPDISHSQMSVILFRNTKARKSKHYCKMLSVSITHTGTVNNCIKHSSCSNLSALEL